AMVEAVAQEVGICEDLQAFLMDLLVLPLCLVTASETPGRNAFSPITPMMISPQIEQITKTMFYNQAGIVGSSVQVGPDRSWGCASFSSLADAQQAIRSLY
ncbi:hypothetical protein FOZ63_003800, partial [Perkinsus olseni]